MAKGKKEGQEAPPGQSATSQGQSGGSEGGAPQGGQRREGGGRGGGGGQRGQQGQGPSGGSGGGGAPGGQRGEGGGGGRGGGGGGNRGQQGQGQSGGSGGGGAPGGQRGEGGGGGRGGGGGGNRGQQGQSGGSGGGGRGGSGGRGGGGGGGPHSQQGSFDSQQQNQGQSGGSGGPGGGGKGGRGGGPRGQQGSFDSQQQNQGQSGGGGQRGEGGRGGKGRGRRGGGGGQPEQQGSYDGGGGGGGQREQHGSFDSGGAPEGGQRRGGGRGRGRGKDPFPRNQEQPPGFQPQSFPALQQDLSQALPTQGAWKKPSSSGEPLQQGTQSVQMPQIQPSYFPTDSKTLGASGDSAKKTPKSQPQQQQQQQQQKRPTRGGGDAPAGPQQSKPSSASSVDTKTPRINTGDAEIVSKIANKPGTKGRIIKVESNHLDLNLGRLTECYHYDVQVEPDKPKRFIRRVLEQFRLNNYPKRNPAFDGVKNIYSVHQLTKDIYDIIEGEVRIRDEDGREKLYKVAIKFANKVDLTPMQNFLQNPTTPTEAIQVVDIVLRMAAVQNCIPAGRSFFMRPTNGIMELGDGMEMYQGFYQSAIRGWKPLLNIDVSHKAFPKAIPVIDTLCELLSGREPFRPEHLSTVRQDDLQKLRKYITTLRVVYEIPGQPGTKKTYRVNGLGPRPADYVFKHNDAPVDTLTYFAKFKNYRIRYPNLPTLWVGNAQREDKIYIPLELCRISEGQAIQRKMNELQTSKMIRYSATDTATRKKKINTGIHTANYNANACVKEFGFSVGSEFQKLDARVLQPPELQYSSNRSTRVSKGVWRSEHFLNAATVNKWTIANVARYAPRPDDYKRMADMLRRAGHNVGMQFTAPPVEPFRTIGQRQAYGEIEEYFRQRKRENFDVIFVVVPDSGPQYSYVKKAAETVAGCLTQCIKTSTVGRKMNDQTATNILLKLNSKLNGINHTFTRNCKPTILQRPVMIMGADVTHPGPDSQNIPSVAAVTASHDPQALFKYNICWRLQNPKAEIIVDLEAITIEHLKFFYRMNQQIKPERIIFFRDGVSEGQFEQVRRDEIRAIKSACKRLQADGYEPSITFVVVQKRHHTRLFPLNSRDSEDRNINVPAGTCVDKTITHPFLQDFYLVSHASIQGVAKPTKYVTLLDENCMSNDDIEELAFYLCHMFSRCTRSVSYPAPTYYAHLAAARAKVYIENDDLDMRKLNQEAKRFETLDVIRKDLPMFFV